jgi:hypothetical protein
MENSLTVTFGVVTFKKVNIFRQALSKVSRKPVNGEFIQLLETMKPFFSMNSFLSDREDTIVFLFDPECCARFKNASR